jgi:DNA-binding CsgD family transcriptional regulator
MRKTIDHARQLWQANCRSAPLDGALLTALFGFTPTEQRVALLLAQGWDAAEIAIQLQVQVNTVRSHIKQLLTKSNSRRQAEFVARVWHTASRLTAVDPHPATAGVELHLTQHLTRLGKDSGAAAPETPPHRPTGTVGSKAALSESSR